MSSPLAAWRVFVERHILPVAESPKIRFDAYVSDLMGPGVIATVLVWEPHLKALFSSRIKKAADEERAKAEANSRLDGAKPVIPGVHIRQNDTTLQFNDPSRTLSPSKSTGRSFKRLDSVSSSTLHAKLTGLPQVNIKRVPATSSPPISVRI